MQLQELRKENLYFEPAADEEGIYVQIQQQKLKIIPREALEYGRLQVVVFQIDVFNHIV